jgi:hypothetical protein
MKRRALVILVGVTATKQKCAHLGEFFAAADEYDVFVPSLPQRWGLKYCVRWLGRYMARTVAAARYERVDYLNYISGGLIFRHAVLGGGNFNVGRVVFIRGPVQEQVPAALVAKYGRFLAWLLFGKMVLELSTADLGAPPLPTACRDLGLIVERGVSRLAASLGLTADAQPPDAWRPERLLPAAVDWRAVPESHDDVYSSPSMLSLALGFLRDGKFPEAA